MTKNQIFIVLGVFATGLLVGHHSTPEKIRVETITVEKIVERKAEAKREDKVIVRTVYRDGTKVTRVESKRESNLLSSKDSHSTATITKDVVNRRGTVVGLLAGLHTGTAGLLYGFHANTPLPILGLPLHVGGNVIVAPLFGLAGFAFLGIEL